MTYTRKGQGGGGVLEIRQYLRVFLLLNNIFIVHFCVPGHKLLINCGCHKYMTANFKFHFFFNICIKFGESCYFHLLHLKSLLHYANVKYSEMPRSV